MFRDFISAAWREFYIRNSYTALSVRPAGNFIGINLDMEHLYEGLENDVSFDELVQYAEDRVFVGLEKTPFFKLDQVPDYETEKKQLVAELAGMTADPYMLAHIPHKNIEDMTMVYRLQIAKFDDNTATILVTNSLMQQWGVTAEQFHQDAICEVTHSYHLTPDQLAKLLEIAKTMPPESPQAQAAMNQFMSKEDTDEDDVEIVELFDDESDSAGETDFEDNEPV